MTTSANLRRIELSAIHAKKKQLGLDDDTYRDMLENVTGKRSAAELDWKERNKVLQHMNDSGAKRIDEWAFVHRADPTRRPMLWKIKVILKESGKRKKYAEGIAKKMNGGIAQPLDFCDNARLHDIIAALQIANRRTK